MTRTLFALVIAAAAGAASAVPAQAAPVGLAVPSATVLPVLAPLVVPATPESAGAGAGIEQAQYYSRRRYYRRYYRRPPPRRYYRY